MRGRVEKGMGLEVRLEVGVRVITSHPVQGKEQVVDLRILELEQHACDLARLDLRTCRSMHTRMSMCS